AAAHLPSQCCGRRRVDLQRRAQHHAVVLACRLDRDQLLDHVPPHLPGVALEGIAPAAPAAPARDHPRARAHRTTAAVLPAVFGLAFLLQVIAADLARLAAPQAPRRTIAPARALEVPFAVDEVAHAHVDAEPAAVFPGAARVAPQRA